MLMKTLNPDLLVWFFSNFHSFFLLSVKKSLSGIPALTHTQLHGHTWNRFFTLLTLTGRIGLIGSRNLSPLLLRNLPRKKRKSIPPNHQDRLLWALKPFLQERRKNECYVCVLLVKHVWSCKDKDSIGATFIINSSSAPTNAIASARAVPQHHACC